VLYDRCHDREVGPDLLEHFEEVQEAVRRSRTEGDPAEADGPGGETAGPRADWGGEGRLDGYLEYRLRAAIFISEIEKLSPAEGGVTDPSQMFSYEGELLQFRSADKAQRFRVTDEGAFKRAFAAGFPEGWPEGISNREVGLLDSRGLGVPTSSHPSSGHGSRGGVRAADSLRGSGDSVRGWGARELHFSHTDAEYCRHRSKHLENLPKPFKYGLHDAEDACILFMAFVEMHTSIGPEGYITQRLQEFLADFGLRGASQDLPHPAASNLDIFFSWQAAAGATTTTKTGGTAKTGGASLANGITQSLPAVSPLGALEKEIDELERTHAQAPERAPSNNECKEANHVEKEEEGTGEPALEQQDHAEVSETSEEDIPLAELPQLVRAQDALDYASTHSGFQLPKIVPKMYLAAQEDLLKRVGGQRTDRPAAGGVRSGKRARKQL
jgi:hypothetical protein